MNQVVIIGRLTKDIELKYTSGADPMAVTKFTVAVNRMKKGEADFISCVAFKKEAEFLSKYFGKGSMVAICGRIQTGSYQRQDGTTVYTTDVVVERAEFCGDNNGGSAVTEAPAQAPAQTPAADDGFMQTTFEGVPFR